MNRRSLIAIASVLLLALLTACGGGEAKLTGTDLGKTAAPDFALTDQHGDPVKLSDFQGKAVALSFIYTSCPDICPLIAEDLRLAWEQLPAATQEKVALVAVSVDPERDTPEAIAGFARLHGLDAVPGWYHLNGERGALEPVWAAYGIDPGAGDQHMMDGGPPAVLAHTDGLYFIDPEGRERVFMRSNASPEAIANNLKALAG